MPSRDIRVLILGNHGRPVCGKDISGEVKLTILKWEMMAYIQVGPKFNHK